MEFNFLEYFYTKKYDNKTVIKNKGKNYTIAELKSIIQGEILYLEKISNKNILINTNDNFDFIILLLSCILCGKNIITSNCNKKIEVENCFEIKNIQNKKLVAEIFEKIDTDEIKITITTSGTTKKADIITKKLTHILKESYDFIQELNLPVNQNYEFIISTPINHLYAITAYIFSGLNSKNIINTDKINYLEDLKIKNSIFISSPSFLDYIKKFNLKAPILPEIILSAGAKLKEDTKNYFKSTNLINLYGSTETGFIAHEAGGEFILFKGIKILKTEDDKTILKSKYSYDNEITLSDRIIKDGDKIKILGRCGRLFKIQEKRVSADEIEDCIIKNESIENASVINFEDKITALVALNDKGKKFLIKNGVQNLIKNIKKDLSNFEIIPQKWKFIDEIPANDMGKINYEKINELFKINLSLPLILKRNVKENFAEFDLCFFRNCNFFKGHFENFPITAGVIQLYYANYFIKEAFRINCTQGQIKRVKFSNIIHPDKIIKLQIIKNEKNIEFEYKDENKTYSSGAMPVYNIFQKEE